MEEINRAEKFLDLYRELEFFGRNTYFPSSHESENIIGKLMALPQLARHKEDLNYCRVVRNFLTHNPKVGNSYSIEPSQSMIDFLTKLIQAIMIPTKVAEICVKRKHMLTVNTTDNLFETLLLMREKNHTHSPVYHKNKFLGILTEQSVSNYMLYNKEAAFDSGTLVDYLSPVIDYNYEANQSKMIFVDEETTFDEIKTIFQYNYQKGITLSAAFITKNGKKNEAIIGMLTSYDLLSHLQ